MRFVGVLVDQRRLGKSGVNVAHHIIFAREIAGAVVDLDRAFAGRLCGVEHLGKRLVVDADQIDRVARGFSSSATTATTSSPIKRTFRLRGCDAACGECRSSASACPPRQHGVHARQRAASSV